MENNEDIKIVEERIDYFKNNPEGCNWKLSFEDDEDIQAIENLLSRLKTAEIENKEYKEYLKKLDELTSKEFIFKNQIKELAEFAIEATNGNTEYDVGLRNGIRYIAKCLLLEKYTEEFEKLENGQERR